MLKIFFLMSLVHFCINECAPGCLSCTQDKECLFCDNKRYKYIPDKFSCEEYVIEDCEIQSQDGECLQCFPLYNLDGNTGTCVRVTDNNHCHYYHGNCILCEAGYYMTQGECTKVIDLIPNCLAYQSENLCTLCSGNTSLSNDRTSCIKLAVASTNCLANSHLKCIECDSGYFLNRNLYFDKYFNFDTQPDRRNFYELSLFYNGVAPINSNPQVCTKLLIENCKAPKSADKCLTCIEGYYLTEDFLCKKFPYDKLDDCIEYLNDTECKICTQGYVWNSIESKCKLETPIDHCSKYKENFTILLCELCDDTHYLQTRDCKERKIFPIENCETYELDRDECSKCIGTHGLTSDKEECLLKPTNCMTVFGTTNDIKCSKCIDGYYLDGTCKVGTENNCVTYSTSINKCVICQNHFYEESGSCFSHLSINNCENLSNSDKNVCEECIDNSQPFIIDHKCQDSIPVENCTKYEYTGLSSVNDVGDNDCTECADGYKLASKECDFIGDNCKKEVNSDCTECLDDFILLPQDSEDECVADEVMSLDYTFCSEGSRVDSNSMRFFTCEKCQTDAEPVNIIDQYICVNRDFYQSKNF